MAKKFLFRQKAPLWRAPNGQVYPKGTKFKTTEDLRIKYGTSFERLALGSDEPIDEEDEDAPTPSQIVDFTEPAKSVAPAKAVPKPKPEQSFDDPEDDDESEEGTEGKAEDSEKKADKKKDKKKDFGKDVTKDFWFAGAKKKDLKVFDDGKENYTVVDKDRPKVPLNKEPISGREALIAFIQAR